VLAQARPLSGDRITIVTNGRGPGMMAADALLLAGGRLASLSDATVKELDKLLPINWWHDHMVDIFANAPVERYVKTLQVLLEDPRSAVVALLHAPTAATPSADIAQAIASVAQQASHNLFVCWLGGDGMTEARRITREARVPTYNTPEKVVGAFRHLVSYRRNQESMLQIPASIASEFTPDSARAGALVEKALAAGRDHLSEQEHRALLAAYGIRVAEERVARTRDEAVQVARGLGYPVTVKILLANVRRGPEVGGVAQDLDGDDEVRAAANVCGSVTLRHASRVFSSRSWRRNATRIRSL
jgi:acetyltransferase